MTKTPKISLIAYESRIPGKVFVRVPDEPGRFIFAERCVVEVECTHCGALVGEPCKTKRGYIVDTHYHRRNYYRAIKGSLKLKKPRVRVVAVMETK